MSAFVCNNRTISAIIKGFEVYSTRFSGGFKCEGYAPTVSVLVNRTGEREKQGQALLNYNIEAVNCRYSEDTKPWKFEFENVEINEGIVKGCIDCYCYQACENPDFYESDLYMSLQRLKDCILERLIEKAGQTVEWGI